MRHGWIVTGLMLSLAMCTGCDTKRTAYRLTGTVPSDRAGFSTALYQSTSYRLQAGHRTELINNGPVFERLAQELGKAKSSINIVLFIWTDGEPSDALLEPIAARARDGVRCRVLVDALGSQGFDTTVQPKLEAAGCEVHMFRPVVRGVSINRNHRKLVIIDGKLALTGGLGFAKTWLGDGREKDEWRDTNVFIRGPAVAEMQQAFAENWQEATGTLLPAEDFPTPNTEGSTWATFVSSTATHLTHAERLTHLAIGAASKRLWIVNAYFVPSPGIIDTLRERVQAGVDVRVMVSGDLSDQQQVLREQRATYPKLLEGGVLIFEYQPSLMHSKTMLVDDHLVVVGSINLDRLSLDLLEEGSLVMSDPEVATELEAYWMKDVAHCKEIQPKPQAPARRP